MVVLNHLVVGSIYLCLIIKLMTEHKQKCLKLKDESLLEFSTRTTPRTHRATGRDQFSPDH